ncbi:hypothetical protein [Dictyobacter formicarum]|nr:hypothetical protein [Dictyobacter formicarum]
MLDINAAPLDDAQVRREEVIGKPLAEAPGGPVLLPVKNSRVT